MAVRPIGVVLSPGQAHESTMLEPLLDEVAVAGRPGRPRKRFGTVAGDKGYDGKRSDSAIRSRGCEPLIARRRNADGAFVSSSWRPETQRLTVVPGEGIEPSRGVSPTGF